MSPKEQGTPGHLQPDELLTQRFLLAPQIDIVALPRLVDALDLARELTQRLVDRVSGWARDHGQLLGARHDANCLVKSGLPLKQI